jgi:hypothetical protein
LVGLLLPGNWAMTQNLHSNQTMSAAPCADAASVSTSTPVMSDPMVAPLRDTLLLDLLAGVMVVNAPVVTSSCLPPTRAGWLSSWVTHMSAAPHDFSTCSTLHTPAQYASQRQESIAISSG